MMRLLGRNCVVLVTFGRPLQVTVRRMVWDRCPLCLSVCNVGVLWPNGWMGQDAFGTEVGLGPGDILLDEDPKRAQQLPTLFGACLLWPNGRPSQQLLSSC